MRTHESLTQESISSEIVSSAKKVLSDETKEKSKLTKEEWREYTKTVWHIANVTHKKHPAVFPNEIPLRLTKLFSFYGETILDPFAGIGTTGGVAVSLGRNAICVEQNAEYIKIIKQMSLLLGKGAPCLTVRNRDSRRLGFLEENSIDLVITSPPYWNKADYGAGPSNLGSIDNYSRFLREVEKVFRQCFRVLKPGRKICIVSANVNQFTEYGLLTFPIAADFVQLLRNCGFLMVSEIIWSKDKTGGRWGSWGNQRPIFGSYPYPPNFLFKNIHEHILVFAKPNGGTAKGPKVRRLKDIMGPMDQRRRFQA